jgi:hypothetical protein
MAELCPSQQSLQSIDLGDTGNALGKAVKSPAVSFSGLMQVTHIALPAEVQDLEELQAWGQLMRSVPALRSLDCGLYHGKDPQFHARLHDSVHEDGLLVRALFGHVKPYGQHPALRLRKLWIQRTELRHAVRTFAEVIDFMSLKELCIFECDGVEGLLQNLAPVFAAGSPALNTLSVFGNSVDPSVASTFIASFTRLKRLLLQYRQESARPILDMHCLSNHAARLKYLFLGADATSDDVNQHAFQLTDHLPAVHQTARTRHHSTARQVGPAW